MLALQTRFDWPLGWLEHVRSAIGLGFRLREIVSGQSVLTNNNPTVDTARAIAIAIIKFRS